jgi:hypothetical protein
VTRQIFDQHRPRSKMAQRLDEAFAGCDQWTVAPASPRRDRLDIAPWLSKADSTLEGEGGSRLPRAA